MFPAALFAAVDINSATAKELQSVKGIGHKTLKKLAPQLKVGPCKRE